MIIVNLDVMLAKRKMKSNELADKIGITTANLSILKTGKAKAIRFTTLEAICKELNCQPGDILEYQPDEQDMYRHNKSTPAGVLFLYSGLLNNTKSYRLIKLSYSFELKKFYKFTLL